MAYESELEALPELEDELEEEYEDESEDELEGEDFFGDLLGEGEDFLGDLLGESEGFLGDFLGESEDESEGEDEYEEEVSPIRKIYPDAVMEHLGELAAEAESEDEAVEHFLPLVGMAASKLLPVVARAVAPMAKRALPKIAKVLTKATPQLTRRIAAVAKHLHRNPQTRHLLRVVPGIARRTVGTIAHKAARGGHITPRTAVHTLARQTRRVLGSPQHRAKALHRHNVLERKFHQRLGHGMTRPHMHGLHRRYGWKGHGGMVPGHAGSRVASGVRHPGVAGMRRSGMGMGMRSAGMGGHLHKGIGGGSYRTGGVRTMAGQAARYGRPVGGGCGCPQCGCCACCGR
jgi:hypothetical protein